MPVEHKPGVRAYDDISGRDTAPFCAVELGHAGEELEGLAAAGNVLRGGGKGGITFPEFGEAREVVDGGIFNEVSLLLCGFLVVGQRQQIEGLSSAPGTSQMRAFVASSSLMDEVPCQRDCWLQAPL